MTEETIKIVPYNPSWLNKFEDEKNLIQNTIGQFITGGINHIGSTAIQGLSAKPVVDIMVGVENLNVSKPAIKALEGIGYLYYPYKPEFMHWFCKPSLEHRDFHLHLVPTDSNEFKAKIAFRDLLKSNPSVRQQYENLKIEKAKEFENNREAYTDAKTEFVKETVRGVLGEGFRFEEQ